MIVLDTHVLVWFANGDAQLSRPAVKAIGSEQRRGGELVVSAISFWEIAMLVSRGRMVLAVELDRWFAAVQQLSGVRVQPLGPEVAVQAVALPGTFHRDPADRFIVALARHVNARLVTADGRIRDYPHVKTVW